MKEGGTFEVAASDGPTASEFETAITAGEVTIIDKITNGHRIQNGATEVSGDDTITGGTERYDVMYRVEGRIKVFDESIKRLTERLDRFSTLRMWYFTNRNYCFGGPEGFEVTPNFDLHIIEGRGTPGYIPFYCDFTAIGEDFAVQDADFVDLSN